MDKYSNTLKRHFRDNNILNHGIASPEALSYRIQTVDYYKHRFNVVL